MPLYIKPKYLERDNIYIFLEESLYSIDSFLVVILMESAKRTELKQIEEIFELNLDLIRPNFETQCPMFIVHLETLYWSSSTPPSEKEALKKGLDHSKEMWLDYYFENTKHWSKIEDVITRLEKLLVLIDENPNYHLQMRYDKDFFKGYFTDISYDTEGRFTSFYEDITDILRIVKDLFAMGHKYVVFFY